MFYLGRKSLSSEETLFGAWTGLDSGNSISEQAFGLLISDVVRVGSAITRREQSDAT